MFFRVIPDCRVALGNEVGTRLKVLLERAEKLIQGCKECQGMASAVPKVAAQPKCLSICAISPCRVFVQGARRSAQDRPG